jgi:hypothetical protein
VGLGTVDADQGHDRQREGGKRDDTEGDPLLAHCGSFPDLGTFVTAELWRTVGSADAIRRRLGLPVGVSTEVYWSVHARAPMNFIASWNAEQAMWEIRQYGAAVEDVFAAATPATHAACTEFGRRAP